MNFLTEAQPAHTRYQPATKVIDNPDAIIIGSGLGALALASTLTQKRSMRVLVLEAGPVPGGATHVHEIDGYEFPAGVHSVGDMDIGVNPGAMHAYAANFVTGGALKWQRMPDAHEYCFLGDEGYPWYSTAEANIEHLSRILPGEGDVRRYYALEEKVQKSAWAWALTKIFPDWLPVGLRESAYRLTGNTWRSYMQRSADHVLRNELGFSQRMAGVFSYMYGNYGRTPDAAPFSLHTSFMFHYRMGAYFPIGGPGQFSQTIIPIIESGGGQVAVGTPVEQILIEGNRAVGVRLSNGHEVRSKLVVSDASAFTTYTQLLPRDVAERHGYAQRFSGDIKPSPTHMCLMAGYDEAMDLPKHIVWQMPRFDDVSPYDLSNGDREYKGKMRIEGMPAYMLCPSSRDPSFQQRYPNKSTAVVLVELHDSWVKRAEVEPAFKAELETRFKAEALKLLEKHFPPLKGKTPKVVAVRSPMGCNLRAWNGCSYGLETSADRFLAHTHWLRPKTTIKGLFLVGQDAFMPGVAGVLIGARFAYGAITNDWLHLLTTETSSLAKSLPAQAAAAA